MAEALGSAGATLIVTPAPMPSSVPVSPSKCQAILMSTMSSSTTGATQCRGMSLAWDVPKPGALEGCPRDVFSSSASAGGAWPPVFSALPTAVLAAALWAAVSPLVTSAPQLQPQQAGEEWGVVTPIPRWSRSLASSARPAPAGTQDSLAGWCHLPKWLMGKGCRGWEGWLSPLSCLFTGQQGCRCFAPGPRSPVALNPIPGVTVPG